MVCAKGFGNEEQLYIIIQDKLKETEPNFDNNMKQKHKQMYHTLNVSNI